MDKWTIISRINSYDSFINSLQREKTEYQNAIPSINSAIAALGVSQNSLASALDGLRSNYTSDPAKKKAKELEEEKNKVGTIRSHLYSGVITAINSKITEINSKISSYQSSIWSLRNTLREIEEAERRAREARETK